MTTLPRFFAKKVLKNVGNFIFWERYQLDKRRLLFILPLVELTLFYVMIKIMRYRRSFVDLKMLLNLCQFDENLN